jgi:hypothetical protein
MGATKTIDGATNYVLQESISAYADEAYTEAKKLSGTGITSPNPKIDTSSETFVGQVKWYKPLSPNINVASLTNSAAGSTTSTDQDFLKYIKTVRTFGGTKVNLQEVVTQEDGLAKIGRDFSEVRAQDEHNAILAVLRGVMIAETINGAAAGSGAAGAGGQTFVNDPTLKTHGFYVDLGAAKAVVDMSATAQGAARAEGFLNAFGMAYKDYEPEWAYLVTSPEMMASFRSANLVDQDGVVDGNITFSTIFNGKFRIIQTRATQGLSAAERTKINTYGALDIIGTKTSFIVLPGSIAMEALSIPEPVEIERNASAYKGGGTTTIWNRWGYVLMPAGYDWVGEQELFPADVDYQMVLDGTDTQMALTAATDGMVGFKGVWSRKTNSALSLGILPVFHS